jgi:hypothetical protein
MPHIFNKLLITSTLGISSMIIPSTHQGIVVQRITAVPSPISAVFLEKKDSLAVSSKGILQEVNWKQNRITTDMIPTDKSGYFVINQERDTVAAACSQEVILYDVKKQKPTWQCSLKEENPSLAFIPSNKLCVFEKNGNVRRSDEKTYRIVPAQRIHDGAIKADHTAEEVVFTTDYVNKSCSELYAIRFDANSFSLIEHIVFDNDNGTPKIHSHSLLSKIIALHYSDKNVWSLYDRVNKIHIARSDYLNNCRSLAFHPKKVSLLGIITQEGFVELYDFYANKVIAKTHNSLWISTSDSPLIQTSIDFFKDGELLTVILNGRLFVLSNLYPKNN